MALPAFSTLASATEPRLDELALAIAAEFGEVDVARALEQLDAFGTEIAAALSDSPRAPHREAAACRLVLGDRCGFKGDRRDYGTPANSMLDEVIARRTGLPITLSIVYVEAARRAGVELAGVGLPGHFVVGHFRPAPPLLLDPFNGGAVIHEDHPPQLVRPWSPHEIATRMLNNLVVSYTERGDLGRAMRASDMRLELPADDATRAHQMLERTKLLARLN
jgi:regulator of sirC expression with transglutaminase-like and TPR domain